MDTKETGAEKERSGKGAKSGGRGKLQAAVD